MDKQDSVALWKLKVQAIYWTYMTGQYCHCPEQRFSTSPRNLNRNWDKRSFAVLSTSEVKFTL